MFDIWDIFVSQTLKPLSQMIIASILVGAWIYAAMIVRDMIWN